MVVIKNLDHIGIAVKDLDKTYEILQNLFEFDVKGWEKIEGQKVRLVKLKAGHSHLELLETTDKDGPIGRFIEKKGEGLHHITLEVEDIEAALAEMEEKGVDLIDKVPRIGEAGSKIAFLHPRSTGHVLVEFVEWKNRDE